ncbi:MAG: hypothetical protein IPK59_18150 [Rhodospirillaceae bacterium]|nr:hypothetical protein [Rhodospirillaceae bacterium]
MTRIQLVIATLGLAIAATGIGFILKAGPASAQEALAGSWDVFNVHAAPWVDANSDNKPYLNEEIARGRITFMADSVQGPGFLNCDKAHFEVMKVPPEYLFQGGLTDPARQAKELGFAEGDILQLSMSCISDVADISMDFDLIDQDTAVFALDNMIYRMKRVAAE